MRRTVNLLVNNKLGVLNRMTNLFLRKSLNIEYLTVGPVDDDSNVSMLTVVINLEEDQVMEEMKNQLEKQVDVISITETSSKSLFFSKTYEKQ
ncbi:acetolactate synthase small subunit [Texcoconibacillus texcoconensis]|uniref:Acetolactate synthase small subunit n=1 Tax=Texcoconibacillus texcoconensis TaxID=1095777 RepID=A0A840QQH7_9BACI|nr:acetolactate synthase-1/3 small subunit [Texcoconibacillus texcoconensis]